MKKKDKRKRLSGITMSEALRRVRIRSVVFMSIEIALILTGVLFYYYDFPKGFKALVKTEYIVLFFSALVFIDLLVFFLLQVRMASIRHKSDLNTANILGADIQEAYHFGQLGLVVVNDDGYVIWTSNLFKDRSIDLLDVDIYTWRPELSSLQNSSSETMVKIEVNNRNYQVEYLSEAKLFIFKDTTDYETIFTYNKEQSTVVGLIVLDNYSEISSNAEDDSNDTVSKVRQELFDYCKEYSVLLRRFRSDSYLVICNYASLEKMENDSFSLLEKVRAIGKGGHVIPTLSIGFAHDFPDVTKLSEMASNAIDIAMSRGGDQAVISKYGQDLKFYGGKTAALENTGRVQFRSVADSIISIISSASNVFVMGHRDMDMDSLGGCLGVKAICDRLNKPCQIVYDPSLTEKKTRHAVTSSFSKEEMDEIMISPKEAESAVKTSTLVIVVDVSVPSRTMSDKLLEKAAKAIVIDHHRRGEEFVEKPVLTYVDTTASSVSEILAEFIHYATCNPKIEVPSTYATLMLSGMFVDTTFFKSKTTGIRSFEAAEILKEFGADNQLADDFLKDEYEEFALVTKIISNLKTPYTGVVYCVSDEKDIVEKSTLAKVANQLMSLKGINACFVIGKTQEKEIGISCRSDGTVNVQLLAEKMGGGGHFGRAACSFKGVSMAIVEEKLTDTLDTYLSEARADERGEEE